MILADAKASGELPSDSILMSAGAGGAVLIFPDASGIWRIFALRQDSSDRSEPTLEEIQRHLDAAGLERIRLFDPVWLSHFAVNERVVPATALEECSSWAMQRIFTARPVDRG